MIKTQKLSFGSALLMACCFATDAAAQIYVNAFATGANNGSSWTDAYTDLTPALASATAGTEVWVAQGIYAPSIPGSNPPVAGARGYTFEIPSGVDVYGGFFGNEATRAARAKLFTRTVLSGAVGTQFVHSVVTVPPLSTGSRIDGFLIREGIADGNPNATPTSGGRGGGIYAENTLDLEVSNLWIEECAAFRGGGLYVSGGHLLGSYLTVRNCNAVFDGSEVGYGGGAYVDNLNSDSDLHNVTFHANRVPSDLGGTGLAQRRGGAMYVGLLSARLTVFNGLFYDNRAPFGGAICAEPSVGAAGSTWINCTVADNSAESFCIKGTSGGVTCIWEGSGAGFYFPFGSTQHVIQNSIVWRNNGTPNNPDAITLGFGGQPILANYSDIQGSVGNYTGAFNIALAPRFVSPANRNYELKNASPCRDSGDNVALPFDVTDLNGNQNFGEPVPYDLKRRLRVRASVTPFPTVDMGVYESPLIAPFQ